MATKEAGEIDSEARRLEAMRAKAPRACALYEEALAFFGGTPPPGKDVMLVGLGADRERGIELTDDGVAYYRKELGLDEPPPARPAPVKKITEPGWYPGLTFLEYHAIDAVNHSKLECFTRTPAHAREAILHPEESTVALALGHAFHTFCLEPHRFLDEYAVVPKHPRRSNKDKAIWAEWEATNKDRHLITDEEFASYERMRESLYSHETARELLTGKGASELSIVWRDPETGLLCKARLDRVGSIGGYSFIGDLKTTKNAGEREFSKDVSKFGYYRQGAWYRKGLAILRPALRRVCFPAVEKEAPFCVQVHELDERALEQGDLENRAFLDTYARCMETGEWPGYPSGLTLIDVPVWAMDGRD